jgi:hypothetical protein
MGIGHEIWQLEGIKRPCFWVMDNIIVDLQNVGKRSPDFA